MTATEPRIEGLNVDNTLALAARLRERADGLPQDAEDRGLRGDSDVMSDMTTEYECGTVGCIAGEYGIWKNKNIHRIAGMARFLGIDVDDESTQGWIIHLSEWLSLHHRESFHATPFLAERLRVMASYLEWLTGAAQ